MNRVKSFLIRLEGEKLWFRNEFRLTGSDKIIDFVVQLEITTNGKRLIPVRYDIRHDSFHRDILSEEGTNLEKKRLGGTVLEDQITIAVNDLISNWTYILTKGGYAKLAVATNIIPVNSLHAAKDYLVNLVKDPSKIETAPNVVELHPKPEGIGFCDSVSTKLIRGKDQENLPK